MINTHAEECSNLSQIIIIINNNNDDDDNDNDNGNENGNGNGNSNGNGNGNDDNDNDDSNNLTFFEFKLVGCRKLHTKGSLGTTGYIIDTGNTWLY